SASPLLFQPATPADKRRLLELRTRCERVASLVRAQCKTLSTDVLHPRDARPQESSKLAHGDWHRRWNTRGIRDTHPEGRGSMKVNRKLNHAFGAAVTVALALGIFSVRTVSAASAAPAAAATASALARVHIDNFGKVDDEYYRGAQP